MFPTSVHAGWNTWGTDPNGRDDAIIMKVNECLDLESV